MPEREVAEAGPVIANEANLANAKTDDVVAAEKEKSGDLKMAETPPLPRSS